MKSRGERKRKSGRFNLVKRIKPRRRSSTEPSRDSIEEMILKEVQLDSPSSAVTLDILPGRESISTLDTERDEECESIIDPEEQEIVPVTPRQEAERTASIQTWCKSCVMYIWRKCHFRCCYIHT